MALYVSSTSDFRFYAGCTKTFCWSHSCCCFLYAALPKTILVRLVHVQTSVNCADTHLERGLAEKLIRSQIKPRRPRTWRTSDWTNARAALRQASKETFRSLEPGALRSPQWNTSKRLEVVAICCIAIKLLNSNGWELHRIATWEFMGITIQIIQARFERFWKQYS